MKAVFLDRDGVINADRHDYVKSVSELRIFAYSPLAIKRLNDAGYAVFVVSNQQGHAKGLITDANLQAINDRIRAEVATEGGVISGFYYCTHFANDKCSCRKPKPGLLLQAAQEHGFDAAGMVMVGDSKKDIYAAKSAKCEAVLVLTGSSTADMAETWDVQPDHIAANLAEAADYIVRR